MKQPSKKGEKRPADELREPFRNLVIENKGRRFILD